MQQQKEIATAELITRGREVALNMLTEAIESASSGQDLGDKIFILRTVAISLLAQEMMNFTKVHSQMTEKEFLEETLKDLTREFESIDHDGEPRALADFRN